MAKIFSAKSKLKCAPFCDNSKIFAMILMDTMVPFAMGDFKNLIKKVESSQYPVIFKVEFHDKDGKSKGGHAMIAYDYYKDGSDYCLKVWDPNCKCMLADDDIQNILRLNPDTSSKSFENFHEMDSFTKYDVTIKHSISLEEGLFNIYDLQKLLKVLGYSNGWQDPPISSPSKSNLQRSNDSSEMDYVLYTNYSTFTVACSDGSNARIENGVKVSGDLDVYVTCMNEVGYDLQLSTFIPKLNAGESYSVVPENYSVDQYTTTLMSYGDGAEGFYGNVKAPSTGTIDFSADGTVSTSFNGSTKHSVSVVRDDMTTPWYCVSADATNNGITVSPSVSEVKISTRDSSEVVVTADDGFNEIEFAPVTVDSQGIRLVENTTNDETATIVNSDDEILTSKPLVHSIIFYTQEGTVVPSLNGIPHGSTVSKPADPTRTGYKFDGWYLDLDYKTAWNFNDPVTDTIGLFAKWTTNSSTPVNPVSPGGSTSSSSSHSDPTYSISVPSRVSGGKVSVTPSSASANQRVTLTVTSNTGYVLSELSAVDNNGKELTLTDTGNGKYTFKMPAGKVTVNVSFEPAVPTTPAWTNPFTMDKLPPHATYPEIQAWVLENHGLKVSSLYISQVKRKHGLPVGERYNKPKTEDTKAPPQCPPEKEAAIEAALRHFGLIPEN